jgi:hypothetical protein
VVVATPIVAAVTAAMIARDPRRGRVSASQDVETSGPDGLGAPEPTTT